MNNDKITAIHDDRNFLQRVFGTLLLDECPHCHKISYRAPNYGDMGYCSACHYSEPILQIRNRH